MERLTYANRQQGPSLNPAVRFHEPKGSSRLKQEFSEQGRACRPISTIPPALRCSFGPMVLYYSARTG